MLPYNYYGNQTELGAKRKARKKLLLPNGDLIPNGFEKNLIVRIDLGKLSFFPYITNLRAPTERRR